LATKVISESAITDVAERWPNALLPLLGSSRDRIDENKSGGIGARWRIMLIVQTVVGTNSQI
jgi:hypothetical protein